MSCRLAEPTSATDDAGEKKNLLTKDDYIHVAQIWQNYDTRTHYDGWLITAC